MNGEPEFDLAISPSMLPAIMSVVKELQAEVRKLNAQVKELTENQRKMTAVKNTSNVIKRNNPTTVEDVDSLDDDDLDDDDLTVIEYLKTLIKRPRQGTNSKQQNRGKKRKPRISELSIDSLVEEVDNYNSDQRKRISDQTLGTLRTVSSHSTRVSMTGEVTSTAVEHHRTNNTITKIFDHSSYNCDNDINDYDCDYDGEDDSREEIDMKRHLFTTSTHRFLFMDTIECSDGTTYKVGLNHKIIAALVILFQAFAYFFFAYLTARDYKLGRQEGECPGIQVIDPGVCYDTEEHGSYLKAVLHGGAYPNLAQAPNATEFLRRADFKCVDPTDLYYKEEPLIGLILGPTACMTLAFFILPDLYEAFLLMMKCRGCRDRFVGILLFSMAVLATVVGTIGFTNAVFTRASDTFLLIVGLLFVHEIDAQFGYLQELIERTREKEYFRVSFQFGCFWWFVYYPIYMCLVIMYCVFIIDFRPNINLLVGYGAGKATLYFACVFVVNALAQCDFKKREKKHTPTEERDAL